MLSMADVKLSLLKKTDDNLYIQDIFSQFLPFSLILWLKKLIIFNWKKTPLKNKNNIFLLPKHSRDLSSLHWWWYRSWKSIFIIILNLCDIIFLCSRGLYDKTALSIVDENLFLIFTRLSDASSHFASKHSRSLRARKIRQLAKRLPKFTLDLSAHIFPPSRFLHLLFKIAHSRVRPIFGSPHA